MEGNERQKEIVNERHLDSQSNRIRITISWRKQFTWEEEEKQLSPSFISCHFCLRSFFVTHIQVREVWLQQDVFHGENFQRIYSVIDKCVRKEIALRSCTPLSIGRSKECPHRFSSYAVPDIYRDATTSSPSSVVGILGKKTKEVTDKKDR